MSEFSMDEDELEGEEFFGPHEVSSAPTVIFWSDKDAEDEELECPASLSTTCTYHIKSLIGRGGMGLVFLAFEPAFERQVAIKVLRKGLKNDTNSIRRFRNEARILSSLQHPGTAPVFGAGTFSDGRPFYAMKLLEGRSLAELIRLDEDADNGLLSVAANICQTMAYAHSKGIVHLDLKPSNIMVGDYGRVRVIDWGLAQKLGSNDFDRTAFTNREFLNSTVTLVDPQGGAVCGTPAYMSPEQARGEAVDERSDVFSLGAILCEILTGSPVYAANNARHLYRRAFRGSTAQAFLRLEQSECELWLISLVKRCLSIDPSERPENAGVLANELSHFQVSALELVESDMAKFFELSPDLFCIAGFDGCFRRVNSNFLRLTGRTQQELLSQPFLNFVHPEDRERTISVMGKLIDGLSVMRFRNRYVKHDGSLLKLEWTAKSVKPEGLIYAVARDVSSDS